MLFLLLTIGPAFLFACGNILEKSGVSAVGKLTGGTSRPWEFFKGIVTNKFWWLGIACSGLATLGYYVAMARYDLSQVPGILNRKIARGTKNFLYEPAMSEAEYQQAIKVGADLVDACKGKGCNILSIGEMGIGNTSPSSIWMHLFCNIPLEECIGAGSGLNNDGIRHKYEVLSKAIVGFYGSNGSNRSNGQPIKPIQPISPIPTILAYFGGFEMVAAIGAMLRAAELRMIILVDGFIMTACALAAIQLRPEVKDFMIFAHCGDESGHKKMLDFLEVKPLLNLGLRLGEGTGALCAYPIVDSAVRMINEMNNFQNANITKYF